MFSRGDCKTNYFQCNFSLGKSSFLLINQKVSQSKYYYCEAVIIFLSEKNYIIQPKNYCNEEKAHCFDDENDINVDFL